MNVNFVCKPEGNNGLKGSKNRVLRSLFLIEWTEMTGELGGLRKAEHQHFVM
jgi:hypothetical protein